MKVPVRLATETAAASTAEECRTNGAAHCIAGSRAALIAARASEIYALETLDDGGARPVDSV